MTGFNSNYNTNQAALLASPFIKLPLGSIRPAGWLRYQLELMKDGFTGRLRELSSYLKDDNRWLGGGDRGWEEPPYWLRGFHDLAVLTGDEALVAEAERWMEAILNSQDEDGYFGPPYFKRIVGKNGQEVCDLWPHLIVLDTLVHHYEHTADPRVVPFMTRFFRFCHNLPDEQFFPDPDSESFGSWHESIQARRKGDVLPNIHWLYNQTKEPWLLDLAARVFQRLVPPKGTWLEHHVVTFTQRFRYPGSFYPQSKMPQHLAQTDYWYDQHMVTWGQMPRGVFAADERIRDRCTDPRQGFETCAMVEFAKSFYILGRITGDVKYADRCEDIMLNHFPASMTPDLKGLHYLTASNLAQIDASANHCFHNEEGRREKGGNPAPQLLFSPRRHRCCQHNVGMGWPWYAQNLWQATADNGLAAWLYAACAVTAKVGQDGVEVTIASETEYPFDGKVKMTISVNHPVGFPIHLRVPAWCEGFTVAINRKKMPVDAAPGKYARIERQWLNGDTINITMPMKISLTEWPRNGSVTVNCGPLSYSVHIEEKWKQYGGTEEWPEWEVFPKSPWNYALAIDRANPEASLKVQKRPITEDQPWTPGAAPIAIEAKARRIPSWGLEQETVQEVPASPASTDEPLESITMIPMGAARLRMTCLPTCRDKNSSSRSDHQ